MAPNALLLGRSRATDQGMRLQRQWVVAMRVLVWRLQVSWRCRAPRAGACVSPVDIASERVRACHPTLCFWIGALVRLRAAPSSESEMFQLLPGAADALVARSLGIAARFVLASEWNST